MFYWYNAVNYKGEYQPTFRTKRDLGEWLRFNGNRIIHSTRPCDLAVAFYPPIHETEFLFSTLRKKARFDASSIGLSVDPLEFRTRAFFDGVMRMIAQRNVPFDLIDVMQRAAQSLIHYSCLVLTSNEITDAESQGKLVEYVRHGGTLILFPMLPNFDRTFALCHIMEESFNIRA